MGAWGGRLRARSALCAALLAIFAALSLSAPVASATSHIHDGRLAQSTRPTQAVAYARIALVRVLTYYDGSVSANDTPVTSPSPCASVGVLVGTTGKGLDPFNYVLTPTAAVNPTTPCQGAQAAFQQVYGRAAVWSIGHIDVRLNVAYTGTARPGALQYAIDPSTISTNGGAGAPALQVLALTPTGSAPAHDLPVLAPPQPSDAPPAPSAATLLDLTGADGQPLGRDAVTRDELTTTLYPVDFPALGAGAATATGPALGQMSVGAAEIDGNGRLIGIVTPDGKGGHLLVGLDEIRRTIGPVSSASGPLMTQWGDGLAAYYTEPPQFASAVSAFGALMGENPDFAGAAPFLSAATAHSTVIPPLIEPHTPKPVTQQPANSDSSRRTTVVVLVGMIAAILALLAAAVVVLLRRRRTSAPAKPAGPPSEETALDLLPRDLPLDALEPDVGAQPTQPLPVAQAAGVEAIATLQLPSMRPQPIVRARKGLALMPLAAGITDAGIKRAKEPNQDNILAVQGIRGAQGRTQPYGLFVVADGMGGHLNGQEASRFAIETVAKTVLPVLTGPAPINETTLMGLLRKAAQQAGKEMHERNLHDRLDMGTTLTGALVVDDMAYIINVGDSRTYLMSPEHGLRQITVDHSVVASLVSAGVIRPEDIYRHPRRNQIYRSLGGEQGQVEVDTFEVPLQAGDKLLLCSDGLWEMVRDPQIEHILRGQADPRRAVELLAREANTNGGEDNIGAVVVRFIEDVPEGAQPAMQIIAAPDGLETFSAH